MISRQLQHELNKQIKGSSVNPKGSVNLTKSNMSKVSGHYTYRSVKLRGTVPTFQSGDHCSGRKKYSTFNFLLCARNARCDICNLLTNIDNC